MGLLGLVFILAAGVTAALVYFLKGNVVWKGQASCTKDNACVGQDANCCPFWDPIVDKIGMCRVGTTDGGTPAAPCVPKTNVLPLSLAVATVALLFTGLVVLLIPGGSSDAGVALHLG